MDLILSLVLIVGLAVGMNVIAMRLKKKQLAQFNSDFIQFEEHINSNEVDKATEKFETLLIQKYFTQPQFELLLKFYKEHLQEHEKIKYYKNNIEALSGYLNRGFPSHHSGA